MFIFHIKFTEYCKQCAFTYFIKEKDITQWEMLHMFIGSILFLKQEKSRYGKYSSLLQKLNAY